MFDYWICDVCNNAEVFYDAEIDWDNQKVGDMKAICVECAKTHKVVIKSRE